MWAVSLAKLTLALTPSKLLSARSIVFKCELRHACANSCAFLPVAIPTRLVIT